MACVEPKALHLESTYSESKLLCGLVGLVDTDDGGPCGRRETSRVSATLQDQLDSSASSRTSHLLSFGGETASFINDAFGHHVEVSNDNGVSGTSFLKLGKFKLSAVGQTPLYSEYPLPGGSVLSQGGGAHGVQLADWLGTIRAFYSYTGGGYAWSSAHAPFGESYSSTWGYAEGFAGEAMGDANPTNTTYWFPERHLRSSQGRWLSTDPAGIGAAEPSNPQTWNRYAYVMNNPMNYVDPLGLGCGDPPSNSVDNGVLHVDVYAPCLDYSDIAFQPRGVGYGFYRRPQVPANNRVPNKITCDTVLPNGRTVGSYVSQLSNNLNQQGQVPPVATPYGPAPNPSLPGPISVASQVFSGTNFRRMFGGPGANYAFLGDAGNFAYGAVAANIGTPLWLTKGVAGAYSVWAHPSSDWGGPWLMDPSARVEVPAGYGAACQK